MDNTDRDDLQNSALLHSKKFRAPGETHSGNSLLYQRDQQRRTSVHDILSESIPNRLPDQYHFARSTGQEYSTANNVTRSISPLLYIANLKARIGANPYNGFAAKTNHDHSIIIRAASSPALRILVSPMGWARRKSNSTTLHRQC